MAESSSRACSSANGAMARRKTASDDGLLDRLPVPVTTHGPDGLTFALAAAATQLSPATLVQRVGTREAMIEAVLLRDGCRAVRLT